MVQLVISIAIIGILAIGVARVINPGLQFQKTRDSSRKANIKLIQTALEVYRNDKQAYPDSSLAGITNTVVSCSGQRYFVNDCNTITKTYLKSVPRDPKTNQDYFYCTDTSCGAPDGGYILGACLENNADTGDGVTTNLPSGMSCPTGISKYYVVTNL